MNTVIKCLVTYFKTQLPLLEQSYQWKVPAIEGFSDLGQNRYIANVALKKYLQAQWLVSDTPTKYDLAKIIVSDWGGVKGNKASTLIGYVHELSKARPDLPLKGIASYSKIFSIADMTKYAIYDARVAVCLNAVQYNGGLTSGLAFNYIDGRNNTTGNATTKTGFAYVPAFKVASLISKGWQPIAKNDTYQIFLETLKECLKHLPQYNLYDLEMVLFANAEKESVKAICGLDFNDTSINQSTPQKAVEENLPIVNTVKVTSKIAQARDIYSLHREKSRKEVLALFINDVGLTPAGASTYYQSIKNALKIVQLR